MSTFDQLHLSPVALELHRETVTGLVRTCTNLTLQLAMILNDQPWYNEPGREVALAEAKSKRYNKEIWLSTIEHAMIYWLENRLVSPGNPQVKATPQKPANQAVKAQPPTAPPANANTNVAAPQKFEHFLAVIQDMPSHSHPADTPPPVGFPVQPAMPLNYNGGQAQPLQFGDPFYHPAQFGSHFAFPPPPPAGPGGAVSFGAPTAYTYGPPAAPHAPYYGPPPIATGHSDQHPVNNLLPPMPSMPPAPPMQSTASPFPYYSPPPIATSSIHQHPASKLHPLMPPMPSLAKGSLSAAVEKEHKALLAKWKQKYFKIVETVDKMEEEKSFVKEWTDLIDEEVQSLQNATHTFAKVHAGNFASVDQDSSKIWGEVIRKHFFLKGKIILETIRTSPNSGSKTPSLSKRLQDALKEHGFI
jgi:hypothetical protein